MKSPMHSWLPLPCKKLNIYFSGTAELIDQVEVSDDMPSEVLKELLTCNGALKVCEATKESMQKSIKCWMKGVEEKEAEYETQIGNLELTVQNLAQVRPLQVIAKLSKVLKSKPY